MKHLTDIEIQHIALGQPRSRELQHLGMCTLCKGRLKQYEIMFRELRDMPLPESNFDVAAFMAALPNSYAKPKPRPAAGRAVIIFLAVAGICLCLSGVLYLLNTMDSLLTYIAALLLLAGVADAYRHYEKRKNIFKPAQ